jgi:hypothetical protein
MPRIIEIKEAKLGVLRALDVTKRSHVGGITPLLGSGSHSSSIQGLIEHPCSSKRSHFIFAGRYFSGA